jgi:hypothetical protein
MRWCETWAYPAQDLLIYRDREGPYFGVRREDIPRHLPMLSEGYLQVCLVADGQRLMDGNGYVKAPSGARALTEEQLNALKRDQR